ncbi:MAG TPA: hypothetical protein VMS93_09075, partial [Candidatus Saccharimonadales bacterium]|nr:hypothetical protein [Candidatus Saccharimonadales bacterium]
MSAAGRAARLAGLAVLLAAGLGLPGTGARAETRAGVPALVFRGPRPERVWALSAPPRVVLDFPAGAAGGAPQLTLGAAGRQVRGGAFRDLEGSHPRVVVTLAQSAPYWVRWDGSEGTLYVAAGAERAAPAAAGGAGPAPGPPAGSPAA